MRTFEISQQRSGAVLVNRYQEQGVHLGAVAVLDPRSQRGPLVRITKPISLAGARAIIERFEEVAKTLSQPEPADPPEDVDGE